ncbi:MAG: PQQ-binding-like beta-propeller repeat protein [Clostridia bacterium]|nr:PQQ-binding-like beta-propeller repeat protein [Clostridia bacterium]
MSRTLSALLCILLLLAGLFSCALAEENDALFPAKEGWLYGYIHSDGTWAISPAFTRAYPFQESGLAPVRTRIADLFSNDEPFRMINRQGETAVLLEDWRLEMEYLGVNANRQTPIIAGNANLLVHRENHRRHAIYLSHTGELLELTPAFLGYEPPYTSQSLARLPGEEDDRPFVLDIRQWGDRLVVNIWVEEKQLDRKQIDSESRRLYILLDADGKKIHEGVFESPDLVDYTPVPITAPYLPIVQGESIAFIDRDGQIVAEGLPLNARLTDEGDALDIEYHKLYQLIETGEQLTYPEYAAYRAGKNPSGYAVYENGYVDAQGKPADFAALAGEDPEEVSEFSAEGVAWVQRWDDGSHFLMDTDGNNLTGEALWNLTIDDDYSTEIHPQDAFFAQPWEPASLDFEGMNYLNPQGKTLFPGAPLYEADPFCNGLARAVILAESCKPLEIYLDTTGKVVWAEDGRRQDVQQWLDSGTVFSPDNLTLEEAKHLIVGEWELFESCNESWPIQLLENGQMWQENIRWDLEAADPSIEECEFVLVIYKDDETVRRYGIHFYSADSFWRDYEEGYKRVPPGYCDMKEAAYADDPQEQALPQGTIHFGDTSGSPIYEGTQPPRQMEMGVMNYRLSAYRDNGGLSSSYNGDEPPRLTGLSLLWEQPIGPAAIGDDPFWQPLIVKWFKNVRDISTISEELKATAALKEVIAIGTDGRIHLFDLYTGQRTRDPLEGGSYAGTPALHETLPILAAPGDTGITFLQMTDGSVIDHLESTHHAPKMVLWQRDKLLLQTCNAVTYTPAIGSYTNNGRDISFEVEGIRPWKDLLYPESPVSGNQQMLYYGNRKGISAYSLYTGSVTGQWTGVGTVVSCIGVKEIASDDSRLLYFGNATLGGGLPSPCKLVCLDADLMEEQWSVTLSANDWDELPNGCIASPVVGEKALEGMVYFTLTGMIPKERKNGETVSVLIALDADTGEILWQKSLSGRTVSSPVAAYGDDGKGYLYQADGEGTLYMVDGLTGETVDSLSLGGSVTSAPALYRQHLVVRVTKGGQEVLCGVGLGE